MTTNKLFQPENDMEELFLSEPTSEAMGIRLADMIRFKEGYNGFVKFALPTDGAVSLADTDAGRAGLVFYDSSHLTKSRLAYLPHQHTDARDDISGKKADALWFVFVIDKPAFSIEALRHFIVKHRIRSRFQKLFLLRFFESSLQQL